MNKYETLYIIKPSVAEEERAALIAKFADVITAGKGVVESTEEMGMRKLAYPIDYITEGYYVLVNFSAEGDLPRELERNFRINENILRFLVIRKEA